MPTYLVRLKANRELVGLFVQASPEGLSDYVDESCDISGCEYMSLQAGGMYFEGAARPKIPTVHRDEPRARKNMPDWFSGVRMTDNWKSVFESENGEKGWKDCPA